MQKDEPVQPSSQEEKIKRFFEIADRQLALKEIIGISSSEIQAEIEAYRCQKSSRKEAIAQKGDAEI